MPTMCYTEKYVINDNLSIKTIHDLHNLLNEQDSFTNFFVTVSKIKVNSDRDSLNLLAEEVRKFSPKFGFEPITYLVDCIEAEAVLPCNMKNEEKITEKMYQNYIISHFSNIFPNLRYIDREVKVDKVGRIDIFAEEKNSHSSVIIELKLGCKNPNRQLIAYGSRYDNPILIGITEVSISDELKLNNIIYFTYDELGIVEKLRKEFGNK